MEVILQKWGNSLGIRIPKNILESLRVKENNHLTIDQLEE